jgi:hypothetical protein
MMAMPAGQFLALRNRLGRLGASSTLLAVLTLALEADHVLAHALATPHQQADPGGHPLGSWVLSRPLTIMTAWPIGGKAPDILGGIQPAARRGPVPAGPALTADERRHVIAHLQAVAERASRTDSNGLLLRRQAYYLTGFDRAPATRHWLADMHRADQRALHPSSDWSATWPLARSTASALTRAGDPEPQRRFIHDQLGDEAAEIANLNYWAFWAGEISDLQTSDSFISTTPLASWHGGRVARHLADRMHGNVGFTELNIHSLWALIRARPQLAPPLAPELTTTITRLLDEDQVSGPARRELETLRYGIAIAQRT